MDVGIGPLRTPVTSTTTPGAAHRTGVIDLLFGHQPADRDDAPAESYPPRSAATRYHLRLR